MPPAVHLDVGAGTAKIGAALVSIAVAEGGRGLEVGGASGPLLRPLSFGERSRVLRLSAASAAPEQAVASAILAASTARAGAVDRRLAEVLALVLAGADIDAPPLSETVLLVARATGWRPAELFECEAAEVDRLAADLRASQDDGGWTRLVLAGSSSREPEIDTLRDDLAHRLLARAAGGAVAETALAEAPATALAQVESRPRHAVNANALAPGGRGEAGPEASSSSLSAAPGPAGSVSSAPASAATTIVGAPTIAGATAHGPPLSGGAPGLFPTPHLATPGAVDHAAIAREAGADPAPPGRRAPTLAHGTRPAVAGAPASLASASPASAPATSPPMAAASATFAGPPPAPSAPLARLGTPAPDLRLDADAPFAEPAAALASLSAAAPAFPAPLLGFGLAFGATLEAADALGRLLHDECDLRGLER